jgi:MerR family transcriptional regulator/heat shock protein HspR
MKHINTSEVTCLINDVAQRVGLSQKRIREYEKAGLIRPVREPSTNNRLFTEKDIRRILRIKTLIHEHGLTIASLRFMVSNLACWLVFDCKEKLTCPAHTALAAPCYEIAQRDEDKSSQKDCKNCPVYLNRDLPEMPLFESFHSE